MPVCSSQTITSRYRGLYNITKYLYVTMVYQYGKTMHEYTEQKKNVYSFLIIIFRLHYDLWAGAKRYNK